MLSAICPHLSALRPQLSVPETDHSSLPLPPQLPAARPKSPSCSAETMLSVVCWPLCTQLSAARPVLTAARPVTVDRPFAVVDSQSAAVCPVRDYRSPGCGCQPPSPCCRPSTLCSQLCIPDRSCRPPSQCCRSPTPVTAVCPCPRPRLPVAPELSATRRVLSAARSY